MNEIQKYIDKKEYGCPTNSDPKILWTEKDEKKARRFSYLFVALFLCLVRAASSEDLSQG